MIGQLSQINVIDYLFNSLFKQRIRQSSVLLAICEGNRPATDGFPSEMDRNAESVSMPWWHQAKDTSKLCITGHLWGDPLTTGGFPSQMESNTKNVSIPTSYYVPTSLLRHVSAGMPLLVSPTQASSQWVLYEELILPASVLQSWTPSALTLISPSRMSVWQAASKLMLLLSRFPSTWLIENEKLRIFYELRDQDASQCPNISQKNAEGFKLCSVILQNNDLRCPESKKCMSQLWSYSLILC